MDDRTGWEIVWNGGPLLPPRDSNPSEVWASPTSADTTGRRDKTEFSADMVRTSKRKYSWTGKHRRNLQNESEGQTGASDDRIERTNVGD